jgi:hypothetical protein
VVASSPRRRKDNLRAGSLHDFTEAKHFAGINKGELVATFESPPSSPSIQYTINIGKDDFAHTSSPFILLAFMFNTISNAQ